MLIFCYQVAVGVYDKHNALQWAERSYFQGTCTDGVASI